MRPVDWGAESLARVCTQLRRKHYTDQSRDLVAIELGTGGHRPADRQIKPALHVAPLSTLVGNARHDSGKPVSFLILDIDYFKSVNDTMVTTSATKRRASSPIAFRANIRGVDLACRFGGEEFVVVMPDTDLSFAYMVAERLRQLVRRYAVSDRGRPGRLAVTISIGVTASEGAAIGRRAVAPRDQALYRVKREGRNRASRTRLSRTVPFD